MSTRKNSLIILITVVILLIIVWFFSISKKEKELKEEKELKKLRKEKLKADIDKLIREEELLEKHKLKTELCEQYLIEKSELIYHRLIQVLVVLYLLTNVALFYFLNVDLSNLTEINGLVFTLLGLSAIFVFRSVKRGKQKLIGFTKNFILQLVFDERELDHFLKRIETLEDQIERVVELIEVKQTELNELKSQ